MENSCMGDLTHVHINQLNPPDNKIVTQCHCSINILHKEAKSISGDEMMGLHFYI